MRGEQCWVAAVWVALLGGCGGRASYVGPRPDASTDAATHDAGLDAGTGHDADVAENLCGGTETLEVVVSAASYLEEPVPVPGAWLTLHCGGEPVFVNADAAGRYVFQGLPAGEPVDVSAFYSSFAVSVLGLVAGVDPELSLIINFPYSLGGQVIATALPTTERSILLASTSGGSFAFSRERTFTVANHPRSTRLTVLELLEGDGFPEPVGFGEVSWDELHFDEAPPIVLEPAEFSAATIEVAFDRTLLPDLLLPSGDTADLAALLEGARVLDGSTDGDSVHRNLIGLTSGARPTAAGAELDVFWWPSVAGTPSTDVRLCASNFEVCSFTSSPGAPDLQGPIELLEPPSLQGVETGIATDVDAAPLRVRWPAGAPQHGASLGLRTPRGYLPVWRIAVLDDREDVDLRSLPRFEAWTIGAWLAGSAAAYQIPGEAALQLVAATPPDAEPFRSAQRDWPIIAR